MKETSNKFIPACRVNILINRIQKVYLLIIFLVALGLVHNLLSESESSSPRECAQTATTLFVYFLIYIGLKLRKEWITPLVLISSAFLLLRTFLSGFEATNGIFGLISVVGRILFVLFSAYQIQFFSKREVRNFLGSRETIIF